jgi:hypothetical protein
MLTETAGILSLLAYAGALIGPGPCVQIAEDRHRLIVWPLLIGPKEGNSLSGMLRTAWDRPDLSVLTKVPLSATGTFVVVIGHVTSREFRSRLADSDLAGGTYNRFLPVDVQRSSSPPDGEGLPPQLVASLGQHLKHAITAGGVGLIVRGPAAQCAWRDSMYDEFVESKVILSTPQPRSSPPAPPRTACASPPCTPHSRA